MDAPAARESNADAQIVSAGPCLWEPEAPPPVAPACISAPVWEPVVATTQSAELHTLPVSLDAWESEYAHARWEPDIRLLPMEPVSTPVAVRVLQPKEVSISEEEWERPAWVEESRQIHVVEPVEPEPSTHANLITFPRDVAATRKTRPRRSERHFAAEGLERQLSIFEVEPEPTGTNGAALVWPEPEWSGIKLEAQPVEESEHEEAPAPLAEVHLAPIEDRLMAALVDGALMTTVFSVLVLAVSTLIDHPLSARMLEIGAATAFLLIGLLYQAFFLMLDEATPGMKYAGISLCTFDGRIPTSAELRRRLKALILSVVPLGLGVAWALFDEDRLCWHDRLSRSYLRKS